MKLNSISNKSKTLYLDDILTFGKYAGFTVRAIVISDIDYILWLIRMYEYPIDKKIREFVKEEWIKQGRKKDY